MVQLPATAAIEYVAAFVTRTRTRTKTKIVRGCLLSGGLMPVAPSSMRIRTVWAFCA